MHAATPISPLPADPATRTSLEAAHAEWKRHRFTDDGMPRLVPLLPTPEVSDSGFGDFAADSILDMLTGAQA
jgi:hypothetical protein